MGENVRVVVRCRPMSGKELDINCKQIIKIEDCSVVIQNPSDFLAPAKTFTFDNAYDASAPTEALYNDICYSLVENVLEGYNGTIFAYGQTGCGKSHTMQGPEVEVDHISTQQRGIISRSFDHIFEAISVATGVQFLALVSYLEIYNESIRDLLGTRESVHVNHALKEIPGEGVTVPSLSTHAVHNARECDDLLRIGSKNRMVGATLMNAGSSRSHSIFTISLEQIETTPTSDQIKPGIRKGKLNLVDLAGSERQNKTGAAGDRLKEATKINLSLSALGNVISALADGKTKHIPYRDSKLTRLLQDSLGGNTKTLMIACISPAGYNYDETLSTLRYASRAKHISNKPKINEDPKDALLRNYQEEIVQLKKMLESSQPPRMPLVSSLEDNTRWLEAEKAKLQREYEKQTNRLKEEHAVQQKEKEELVRDMERLKTHYDNQLKDLTYAETNNNRLRVSNLNENHSLSASKDIQFEFQNRIEIIKNALIGGERANDVQLKETRHKKKLAAQGRLSALAHALSRVEQTEDRNLLQGHYSSIQQELKVKNESLKNNRQKIRALEREVSDLQSEFQLDRADYLETIRRLERNMKFYQQFIELALPILRKDGKYWDPDEIMKNSFWNDDLKNWKLPEKSMNSFKLPLAASAHTPQSPSFLLDNESEENDGSGEEQKLESMTDNDDIASNYFRPRRHVELIHQRKENNKAPPSFLDFTKRNQRLQQPPHLPHNLKAATAANWMSLSSAASCSNNNRVLSSWLPQNHRSMSKTWCGLTGQLPLVNSAQKQNSPTNSDPIFKASSVNYREGFLSRPTIFSPNSKASVKLYPIPMDNSYEQ